MFIKLLANTLYWFEFVAIGILVISIGYYINLFQFKQFESGSQDGSIYFHFGFKNTWNFVIGVHFFLNLISQIKKKESELL